MAFDNYKKLFEVYDRKLSEDAQGSYEYEGGFNPKKIEKFNKRRIVYLRGVMRKGKPFQMQKDSLILSIKMVITQAKSLYISPNGRGYSVEYNYHW